MSLGEGWRRGAWDPAVAACGALLLCLAQLAPTFARPGRSLWGAVDADGLGLVWTLWHGAWQLFHGGGLGLESAMVGFPDGGRIVPADPIEVVLCSPFTVVLGAVAVFNLLQLLHVAAAAALTCWLARDLVGDRATALAVAGAVAFSPMLLATTHNGNVDVGQVYLLPLVGGLAWRAARRGWGWTVAAGLVLGLSAVANVYVGAGAAVVCGALFIGGGPVRWGRLVAVLVLAAAVAAPGALLFGGQIGHDESLVLKDAMSVARMRTMEGAGTLMGLVTPGMVRARLPSGDPGPFFNGYGLCWVLVALSIPRLRRPDRLDAVLWAVVLAGLLLVLGPRLLVAPVEPGEGGGALPLPYALLERVPPFDMLIELWRFSIVTQLGLALLAARTLAGRRARWIAGAGALVLIEALFVTPGRAPWSADALPREPVVALVAGIEDGAVLHYPLHQGDWPLYYQTLHHHPVANAPMGKGDPELVELVAGSAWTMAELRERARARGFRWMIVHTRRLPDRPQRPTRLVEDLEAADLVLRSKGSIHLVDLDVEGSWPTRINRPPAGKKAPGPPRRLGIPGG